MCFSGLLMPGHALVCPIRTANQQQLLKWAWCWWVKFCWIGLNPGTLAPSCELCLFVCNQIISLSFQKHPLNMAWLLWRPFVDLVGFFFPSSFSSLFCLWMKEMVWLQHCSSCVSESWGMWAMCRQWELVSLKLPELNYQKWYAVSLIKLWSLLGRSGVMVPSW